MRMLLYIRQLKTVLPLQGREIKFGVTKVNKVTKVMSD